MNFEEIDLNRFEIIHKIGSGGFARVYKIKDKNTEKQFAAKIMKKSYKNRDTEEYKQLEHEILTMYDLDYPSVVKLVGYSPINFRGKKHPMIITPFFSNGSLEIVLDSERDGISFPCWDDTRKLINIYGIASAMSYLHSKNIIHRDLKPDNILMDDSLFPVISDFGLAKNLEIDPQSKKEIKGTIKYIAPEVLKHYEYTKKCDVYAFAIIVYEIVSVKEAYEGLTKDFELYNKVFQNIRPEIDHMVPECYKELIEKCWQSDPNKRPDFDQIKYWLETNKSFILDTVVEEEYYNYREYLYNHQQTLEQTGISISKDDFMKKKKIMFRKSFFQIKRVKVDEPEDDEFYLIAEKYYNGSHQYPIDKEKAASLYKKSADEGNSNAMVKYGEMLFNGDGIQKNKKEAIKYFQMGAEENNTEAVMKYASILFNGVEIEKNKEKAIELYERAANNGNVEAMIFCADLFYKNDEENNIIKQDMNKAMEYYKKAADNDDNDSTLKLVQMIINNEGFEINNIEKAKYYKKAADLKNFEAMYHYANALYYGIGVNIDQKEAVAFYKKAADNGSSNAMNKYAYHLYNGIFVDENKIEAVKYYKNAIKLNNTDAMFNYGRILLSVDKKSESTILFQKAADLDHIESMNQYAEMLLKGDGIEQNKNEAEKYYKKAANTNDPVSIYKYATFLYDDGKKSDSSIYFERAANLDHTDSMFKIAYMYNEGEGIEANYEKAFQYYKMASDKNHLKAINNLGLLYKFGKGVQMNSEEATKCFQKAADLGEINAMNNYANSLFYGNGIQKDIEQAANLYKISADNGNDVAMNNYANMLLNGYGIKSNKEEAFEYFKKAADAGNMHGFYNYALCLESGQHMNVDYKEIKNLLKSAADKGHIFAAYKFACILLKEENLTEAAIYFKLAADAGHLDSLYQYGRCNYFGIGMNEDKKKGFLYIRAAANKGHKKANLFLKCAKSNSVCSIF